MFLITEAQNHFLSLWRLSTNPSLAYWHGSTVPNAQPAQPGTGILDLCILLCIGELNVNLGKQLTGRKPTTNKDEAFWSIRFYCVYSQHSWEVWMCHLHCIWKQNGCSQSRRRWNHVVIPCTCHKESRLLLYPPDFPPREHRSPVTIYGITMMQNPNPKPTSQGAGKACGKQESCLGVPFTLGSAAWHSPGSCFSPSEDNLLSRVESSAYCTWKIIELLLQEVL